MHSQNAYLSNICWADRLAQFGLHTARFALCRANPISPKDLSASIVLPSAVFFIFGLDSSSNVAFRRAAAGMQLKQTKRTARTSPRRRVKHFKYFATFSTVMPLIFGCISISILEYICKWCQRAAIEIIMCTYLPKKRVTRKWSVYEY